MSDRNKPVDIDDLKRFAAEMSTILEPTTERVERLDIEDLISEDEPTSATVTP